MLLSKLTPVILYSIKSTRGLDGDLIEEYENIFEAERRYSISCVRRSSF